MLGGSSAINYMMYNRGQKIDYDDWCALVGDEWGWEGLLPYMLKHEHFDERGSKYSYQEGSHGRQGAIHTSFPTYRCPIEDPWLEACEKVNGQAHPSPKDACSGDHTGVYTALNTIDTTVAKGTRSYAATAYLIPILGRSNLRGGCSWSVSFPFLRHRVGQLPDIEIKHFILSAVEV